MTEYPTDGLSPTDYGWYVDDGLLKPTWFEGPPIPDSLFTNDQEIEIVDDSNTELEVEGDDELEAWSEDSDSGQEDDE